MEDNVLIGNYIRALKKEIDILEPISQLWEGLEVKLEDVYLPLKVKAENGSSQTFEDWLLGNTRSNFVSVWGDPGSGKTTLIQATVNFLIDHIREHKVIPLFVHARNWQKKEKFEAFFEKETKRIFPEVSLHELLSAAEKEGYKIYFFLDGVDELPEDFGIEKAGKEFHGYLAKHQVIKKAVITVRSREESNLFFEGDYHTIWLPPMDDESLNRLFEKWVEKIGNLYDPPRSLIDEIKGLLIEDTILRELSRTPLLLVLSFIWLLVSDINLNEAMGLLMEDIVKKVFLEWDKVRGIKFERNRHLEYYFEVFEKIAIAELEGKAIETSCKELDDCPIDAEIIDELKKRGVFVRERGGKLEFINSFFRNYFAASYMARDPSNYLRYFALKLFDPEWDTPFKITFYILQRSTYESIEFLNLLMETYNPFDEVLCQRLKKTIDYLSSIKGENFKGIFYGVQANLSRLYKECCDIWKSNTNDLPDLNQVTPDNIHEKFRCPFPSVETAPISPPAVEGGEYRLSKVLMGKGGVTDGGIVSTSSQQLLGLIKSLSDAKNSAEREEIHRDKKWKKFYEEIEEIRLTDIDSESAARAWVKEVLKTIDAIRSKIKSTKENRVAHEYLENLKEIYRLIELTFLDKYQTLKEDFSDKLIEIAGDLKNAEEYYEFLRENIRKLKVLGHKSTASLVCRLKDMIKDENRIQLEFLTPFRCDMGEILSEMKKQEIVNLLSYNLHLSYSRPAGVIIFDLLFGLYRAIKKNRDEKIRKALAEILLDILTKRHN